MRLYIMHLWRMKPYIYMDLVVGQVKVFWWPSSRCTAHIFASRNSYFCGLLHYIWHATTITWISGSQLTEITAWINNHIHCYLWDAIHHPCPNFEGGMTKSSLKFKHSVSCWCNYLSMSETYRQVSNIRRTWVDNEIVDHSDVIEASPVGAAPTISSFSTERLASV